MKITFKLQYHTIWGENLCLVAQDRKYPMQWNENDIWSVTLQNCTKADLEDYTYMVRKGPLIWRTEWKHHCASPAKGQTEIFDAWIDCPIAGCPFPREHQAPKFDIPGFRGSGIAVPVFSLRTEKDFGIGEFHDLRKLVDWAAATGQCIIQMLPVNDTTRDGGWDDSYPYSPVSSFALHPLYIHLQDLGIEEDDEFKKKQAALNALADIDYPKVFKAKMAYIRKAFKACGKKDMETAAFRKFVKENAAWLEDYAQFCARRDSDAPELYRWIQFHLDKQLSREVAYARKKGISLKGDLPIGVSGDSADAYVHPELFNLDSSAGAPPDYFSTDGQNWGFPTYNWTTMAEDDYAWWKARLRKMSKYFDAFRIDHILGFFRIWEIPAEYRSGLMGHFNPAMPYSPIEISSLNLPVEGLFHEDPRHPGFYQPLIGPDTSALDEDAKKRFQDLYNDFFYHRHNEFWRINAEKKLPELLSATGMLACGEDLGMIPDCVPSVMEHEKILSLEMSMMDKGRPWPYLSVCATSSHDMDTLRMQYAGSHNGEDPEPRICRNTLEDHLSSASMLAVFPIQDWLSISPSLRKKDFMSERINHPEDIHNHWKYRLHIPLEKLTGREATELNVQIQNLLKGNLRFNQ